MRVSGGGIFFDVLGDFTPLKRQAKALGPQIGSQLGKDISGKSESELRSLAVQLKRTGLGYKDIGRQIGISDHEVRRLISDEERHVRTLRGMDQRLGGAGRSTTLLGSATHSTGERLRSAARYAAGAAAAYLSISQIKSAIDTTTELSKTTAGLNRNLGLSIKESSRWGTVAHARDIDAKSLTMSFTTLSRRFVDAAHSGGTLLAPFKRLGITQAEVKRGSDDFNYALRLTAQAFGDTEAGAKRQASAQQLLGRGYSTILPLFTEGEKSLREQEHWADEYGSALDRVSQDKLMDFVTAQRESKAAMTGLQVTLTTALAPALIDAEHKFQDFARILGSDKLSGEEKIKRIAAIFEEIADEAINVFADVLPQIASQVGQQAPKIAEAVVEGFVNADVWGKAVIGAAVASKLLSALTGAGLLKSVGVKMGLVVATGAGEAAVGTALSANLISGLTAALPYAIGAAGLANIITSATQGDFRDAGVELGGALVGGLAGFMAGGPLGAIVGAGIGSVLGGVVSDLFDSGHEVSRFRRLLQESAKDLGASFVAERHASVALRDSSRNVAQAHRRTRIATREAREAEEHLTKVRRQYPANSKPVREAEQRLAAARRGVTRATKAEQNAERLHGVQLDAAQIIYRHTILAENRRIKLLKEERRGIQQRLKAAIENFKKDRTPENYQKVQNRSESLQKVTKSLSKVQLAHARTIQKASREIGPKYAASLDRIQTTEQKLDKQTETLARSNRQLNRIFGFVLPTGFDHASTSIKHFGGYIDTAKGKTDRLSGAADRAGRRVPEDYGSMDRGSSGHLRRLGQDTNRFLDALGVKKVNFRAPGGFIPGSDRRDRYPAMLGGKEAVVNVHQQPHVERGLAVAKAMGLGRFGSLRELFSGERRPNYLAAGGFVKRPVLQPQIGLAKPGQGAIDEAWKAALGFEKRRKRQQGTAGVYHGPLNRIFPHPGGPQISFNAAAYLAEKAGLPGVTYAQIAIGESDLRPGAVSSDGGYGLWQMTPRVQSAATVAKWNALGSYFNPWTNAQMAKVLAGGGTGTSNYFGTGSVTNWNKHYRGPKPAGAAKGGFFARGGYVDGSQGQRGALRRSPGDQETARAARRGGAWHNTEPRTLNRLFAVANKVNRAHFPYVLGGGHSGTPAPFGPFDCSGAVSYLVQQSGWSKPTTVSGGMTGWFHGGKGKDFSILANAEHVYAVIGGKAWGTSESNPGGGAGWISGYTYRPGFSVRHPDLGTGGAAARDTGPSEAELRKREQRRRANHRIAERFAKLKGLRRVGLGGAGLDKALSLARFWHYFRDVKGPDEKRWAGLEKRLDIARTPAAKRMVLGQLRRTQRDWGEEEISGHTFQALKKAHGPMPGYDTPADRSALIVKRTAELDKLKFTLANAVTDKGRVKALDALSDFWAKYGVFGPQRIRPKVIGDADVGLGTAARRTHDWRPLAKHLVTQAYADLKPKRHLEAEQEWIRFANKRGRIGGMPEVEAKRRLPRLAKTKIDSSERIANLKELLRLTSLRLAVSEAQGKALADYPTIEGAMAKGGPVLKTGTYLVGEDGPELAELSAGTRIRSNAETRTLATPDVRVIVHGDVVSDRRDPIEVRVDDRQIDARVEKAMRRTGRRAGRPLAGRGGGRI